MARLAPQMAYRARAFEAMSFVQYAAASQMARKTCARLKLSGPRASEKEARAKAVLHSWWGSSSHIGRELARLLHKGYVEGYGQIFKQAWPSLVRVPFLQVKEHQRPPERPQWRSESEPSSGKGRDRSSRRSRSSEGVALRHSGSQGSILTIL